MLLFIEEAVRRDLARAEVDRIIADAKVGGDEFCVRCFATLGYPAMSTHIHARVRFQDGAYYTEGAGQTCATCAEKEKNAHQGAPK